MDATIANFIRDWVHENIHAGAYADEGQLHPEAADAARRLVAEAESKGVSKSELEREVGDLEVFLSEAFESATDREVDRQARKDR